MASCRSDADHSTATSCESQAEPKTREELLAAACIAREPGAIEELLARYTTAINAGIVKATGVENAVSTSADGDDLYQVVCVELWSNPHGVLAHFRSSLGDLASWLFGVAYRIASKHLESKDVRWPDHTIHLNRRRLDELPVRSDELQRLTSLVVLALDAMNERSRVLLKAAYGLDPFERAMSVPEIAEEFDCSISTTYRRLRRALGDFCVHVQRIQNESGRDVEENLFSP